MRFIKMSLDESNRLLAEDVTLGKSLRHYYAHRDEILAKRVAKRQSKKFDDRKQLLQTLLVQTTNEAHRRTIEQLMYDSEALGSMNKRRFELLMQTLSREQAAEPVDRLEQNIAILTRVKSSLVDPVKIAKIDEWLAKPDELRTKHGNSLNALVTSIVAGE